MADALLAVLGAFAVLVFFEWLCARDARLHPREEGSRREMVERESEPATAFKSEPEEVIGSPEYRARKLMYDLLGAEAYSEYRKSMHITLRDQKIGWLWSIYPDGVVATTHRRGSIRLCVRADHGYPLADRVLTLALMARSSPYLLCQTAGDGRATSLLAYRAERHTWAKLVQRVRK